MHTNFGEWYRAAGMQPDGETLLKRWTGIEEYLPDKSDIAALLRMFYGFGPSEQEFLAEFRSVFQKADAAFPMKGNDRELMVLAGAEIIDVIERGNGGDPDLACLGVVCGAVQNLRITPIVPEILGIAATRLSSRSSSSSKLKGATAIPEDEKKFFEAIKLLGEPWTKVLPWMEKHSEQARLANERLVLLGEESNILWWLFSEYSRDLKCPWRDVPRARAALLCAKELADLTELLPGPLGAEAFLDRAIGAAKEKTQGEIAIKDAVSETPEEWRHAVTGKYLVPELEQMTPFLWALKQSLSPATANNWWDGFGEAAKLPASTKAGACVISYQFYLELLLSRVWQRNGAE